MASGFLSNPPWHLSRFQILDHNSSAKFCGFKVTILDKNLKNNLLYFFTVNIDFGPCEPVHFAPLVGIHSCPGCQHCFTNNVYSCPWPWLLQPLWEDTAWLENISHVSKHTHIHNFFSPHTNPKWRHFKCTPRQSVVPLFEHSFWCKQIFF